jgi:hypothetical protein
MTLFRVALSAIAITSATAAANGCSQTLCVDAFLDVDIVMSENTGSHITDIGASGEACRDVTIDCTYRKTPSSPCTRYSATARATGVCTFDVVFDDRPAFRQTMRYVAQNDGICPTTLIKPEYPAFRIPDYEPEPVYNPYVDGGVPDQLPQEDAGTPDSGPIL